MKKRKYTLYAWVFVILGAGVLNGCTKEKAEAIKVTVEQFRIEAIAAINQLKNIVKQSIEMPAQDENKLIDDLEQEDTIDYDKIKLLLAERDIGAAEADVIDEKMQELEGQYNLFASMFNSLPKGSFFAAKAVERAQKHAMNLTVQLINFAQQIKENKIAVKANAKRILLVGQINQNKSIQDPVLRRQHLKNAAQSLRELYEEESRIKNMAIIQCLKAAETGRQVAQMIRDYKSLTVGEVLTLSQQSLGFISEISDQSAYIEPLLKKYQAIETTIKSDPYWKNLLDEKIIQ